MTMIVTDRITQIATTMENLAQEEIHSLGTGVVEGAWIELGQAAAEVAVVAIVVLISVTQIERILIEWENEDEKILTSSHLAWAMRINEFDQVTIVRMAEEEEVVVRP